MAFPDQAAIAAHHAARAAKTEGQRKREEHFRACETPEALAELAIREIRELYSRGILDLTVTFPCDRKKLEEWIATHKPPSDPKDMAAGGFWNPTLENAVYKAIKKRLNFQYIFGLYCIGAPGGLQVKVLMKL